LVKQQIHFDTLSLKFCCFLVLVYLLGLQLAYLKLQHLVVNVFQNFASLGWFETVNQFFASLANRVVLLCQQISLLPKLLYLGGVDTLEHFIPFALCVHRLKFIEFDTL